MRRLHASIFAGGELGTTQPSGTDQARGFRNRQIFINAIYFHCGGLDMNPVPTKWLEASIILQFI